MSSLYEPNETKLPRKDVYNRMAPWDIDVIIDILDDEITFLMDISHIPYVNRRINKILSFKRELTTIQAETLCRMEDLTNGTSKQI